MDLIDVMNNITLIYGQNDTATPASLVYEVLDHSMVQHNLCVIPVGGHDIANTHTEELVSLILKEKEVPDDF